MENKLNKTNRRELFLKMANIVYTDALFNKTIDIETGIRMLRGILEMRENEIIEEDEKIRNIKKYPYSTLSKTDGGVF